MKKMTDNLKKKDLSKKNKMKKKFIPNLGKKKRKLIEKKSMKMDSLTSISCWRGNERQTEDTGKGKALISSMTTTMPSPK